MSVSLATKGVIRKTGGGTATPQYGFTLEVQVEDSDDEIDVEIEDDEIIIEVCE